MCAASTATSDDESSATPAVAKYPNCPDTAANLSSKDINIAELPSEEEGVG
eukprot:CAMPEP_0184676800 /NCGR_PEP_ID=MMETSP0308-20130426/88543_1 /TAXON_ID=38269 /ORGANISM="Gloeochaete witrockiana, Strain SAG 46.84" /LENGTH=50 /DNA_ID=CAMNT_0027124651 /DNA_START=329 /DNA_END=482 /DNA_ORIENTATION=-